jgi:hypothetical protein
MKKVNATVEKPLLMCCKFGNSMGEMRDTSVSDPSLGKRADHSPMYPDPAHGVPKFTL